MYYLNYSSCSTCHGFGSDILLDNLLKGERPVQPTSWHLSAESPPALLFPGQKLPRQNYQSIMLEKLVSHWQELRSQVEVNRDSLGVIFASTKGPVEDYIWQAQPADLEKDYLYEMLLEFLRVSELQANQYICVSNACASVHSSLFLAQLWLEAELVEDVVIIAADMVGPFVLQGFSSLHALSNQAPKPMAADRDGTMLGDGAGILLVSQKKRRGDSLRLSPVGLSCEGHAVTRSTETGEALVKAVQASSFDHSLPDVALAHGTATKANDVVEERAIREVNSGKTPITATKWSVGHTLGCAGLIDICAASEMIRQQKVFRIATTTAVDDKVESPILVKGSPYEIPRIDEVLITSLGFGGVHSALRIRRDV